jgi:hypothetical protein
METTSTPSWAIGRVIIVRWSNMEERQDVVVGKVVDEDDR